VDQPNPNSPNAAPQAPKPKPRPNPKAPRQVLPVRSAEDRLKGSEEVSLGFALEQVGIEALRCLQCKDPVCTKTCPLHIDIKSFIGLMAQGDFEAAFQKISEESPFPGICGRVCQHELFCEKACLLGKKLEPVAIGSLERFAADAHHDASAAAPRPAPTVDYLGLLRRDHERRRAEELSTLRFRAVPDVSARLTIGRLLDQLRTCCGRALGEVERQQAAVALDALAPIEIAIADTALKTAVALLGHGLHASQYLAALHEHVLVARKKGSP